MLGCIVCRQLGSPDTPAEFHHIGDLADRSDFLGIPLCHEHHRTGGFGVAFHAGPKEWQRIYGSELKLLAETHKLLA